MENLNLASKTQGREWNQLTEDEIPEVIENLRKFLPESLIMYNFVSECMKLSRKSGRTNVTLFHNSRTRLLIAASKGVYRRAAIYTPNKNYIEIKSFLEDNKMINWNDGSVLFSAISLDLSEYIKDLCPSIGKRIVFCDRICDCYWMPADTAKTINVECPDEMYFSPLEDCHTEIVNSTWNYGSSETYCMVSDFIKCMDTVGLFTKKDAKLVSWALNAVYGIGLLYTMDEYRSRGYGTLVVKKLANNLGKSGINPFIVSVQSNSVAKLMFQKCGFINLEPAVFMEIENDVDKV